jgi:hypothetical protein
MAPLLASNNNPPVDWAVGLCQAVRSWGGWESGRGEGGEQQEREREERQDERRKRREQ